MAKKTNAGGSDEEVIRTTGELITTLANDPSILQRMQTFFPDLEKFRSAHDRHRNLFAEVLGGKHEMEGDLEAARNHINTHLDVFHGMVALTGSHDPSITQSLGIVQPVTKRNSVLHLTSADNFRMVYDGKMMVARANGVKGAKSYELWVCDGDPMIESNWRYLTNSTRINHIEVTGLTPGKLYYFRIRAICSHGNGPWSNFVSMMAI